MNVPKLYLIIEMRASRRGATYTEFLEKLHAEIRKFLIQAGMAAEAVPGPEQNGDAEEREGERRRAVRVMRVVDGAAQSD
jgi:hypothetical protein